MDPKEIIEQSRQQRQQRAVEQARVADARKGATFSAGQDNNTGQPLVRAIGGAAVPMRSLSSVQPEVGQQGRSDGRGFDSGGRIQPDRRRRSSDSGDVTVLVSRTVNGQTELWLGGDRSPVKIATIPSTSVEIAELELTGPSKNNWIVSVKYNNSQTAQLISGDGNDWIVTDPRIKSLSYLGNGFWGQTAAPPSANPSLFAFSDSQSGQGVFTLLNNLGVRTGSNCYSAIEGLSTITVAYCESYTIVGPQSLSSESYDINEGLVQSSGSPFTFSGTNISNFRGSASASILGTDTGPGYLGPGGAVVSPQEPPIVGSESLSTKRGSTSTTYTRDFSSTVHAAWLFNGQVTESVGIQTISASSQSERTPSISSSVKRRDYLGAPSFVDFQTIWRILVTSFELWPAIPASDNGSSSPINSAISYSQAIAPGVIKSNQAQVVAPYDTPTIGTGSATYAYAGNCFPGGYSWVEEIISAPNPGDASTNLILGTLGFTQGSRTRKNYFNWLGANIEATSIYGQKSSTWQPDPQNPSLPISTSATLESSTQIFQRKTEATITISRAITTNGKLSFQGESTSKKVKVLPMISVTGGVVRSAKYWEK
jgi:hypothetical protein